MARKKKIVYALVALSVDPEVSAADARRELRSRVNDGCDYYYDEHQVRARSVSPFKLEKHSGKS